MSSLEMELPVITRDRRRKTDFKIIALIVLYNATGCKGRDNEPDMDGSVFNCRYGFIKERRMLHYSTPDFITVDETRCLEQSLWL